MCEAAATGGKFTSTTIALAEADSDHLEIVAAAGPTADERGTSVSPSTPTSPKGAA